MVANEYLSLVYSALRSDETVTQIFGDRIYTQSQAPQGSGRPMLLVFIRNSREGAVGRLNDTFIEFVIRHNRADNHLGPVDQGCDAVDRVVNQQRFASANVSGTMSRSKLPVSSAIYDEYTMDWVKRWMYRVTIKQHN